MVDYVVTKLPRELKTRFQELNAKYGLGYTAFAEFVKDAMRRRFEEIEAAYHKDS